MLRKAISRETPRGEDDLDGRGLWIRAEVLSAFSEGAPDECAGRILRELQEGKSFSEEARLVSGLADRSYGAFSPDFVAERLTSLRESEPDRRRAWLRLIAPWEKSADKFLKPLAGLRQVAERDPTSLMWWLRDLASLSPGPGGKQQRLAARLGERVVRHLRHTDARVQLQAARALGVLGGEKAIKGLRKVLRRGRVTPPTHEAALVSLVALQGKDAMDVLLEQNPRSPHVLTVVRVLSKLDDPRGVPMLQKILRVSTSQTSRKEARLALDRLRKLKKEVDRP